MRRYRVVAAAFMATVLLVGGLAYNYSRQGTLERVAEKERDEFVRLSPDQQDKFSEIIRSRGLACAKVVEARKRQAETYYVECETHPDKLERKAYTLDLATNRAR